MPSYVAPDAEYLKRVSGLQAAIEDWGDADFDAALDECLEDAEAEFAALITDAVFDSASLSARKARLIRTGVAYLVLAGYLFRPQGQHATGTNAPLTMDGNSISILRLDYVNRATRYARLISGQAAKVLDGLGI